jgi:hypothetical protein
MISSNPVKPDAGKNSLVTRRSINAAFRRKNAICVFSGRNFGQTPRQANGGAAEYDYSITNKFKIHEAPCNEYRNSQIS